jgi:aldose sugar dehydrogenase
MARQKTKQAIVLFIVFFILLFTMLLIVSACVPFETGNVASNGIRNNSNNSSNVSNDDIIDDDVINNTYIDDEPQIIAQDLDTIWAMDSLPTGEIIFTERNGVVSILNNSKITRIGNIAVRERSEAGLLGIAVDPDFNNTKYIFVYYSYNNLGMKNRVSQFVLSNGELTREKILLDNIPGALNHDGGRIKFGPDGKLYVTTGDAANPETAKDINSLAGKILRMNKDGTIPEDNPFGNYVYSYGHRNPQGLTWSPEGVMYSSEHGPSSKDEINLIVPGDNYGWPNTCEEVLEGHIAPIRCYSEFTLAPGGIAYHNGALYVAGLRGAQVRRIVLGETGEKIISEEVILDGLGRIRDVVVLGDFLYISTSNRDGRGIAREGDDKIIRIRLGE